MVIVTDTLLGMRCPECGKLDFHKISRFDFSGRKQVEIKCACGFVKLFISTRNRKDYLLQVPCVVCEARHVHSMTAGMLWSGEVDYLYCQETGLELGYLGPEEEVQALAAVLEENLDTLDDELGKEDEYFHNPGIMYEVLNCLHDIAEQGALYCQCGNRDVDVDIFPDRLELHCRNCDSVNIVYAETEDDLKVIREIDTIELTRNGFKCLDSLASTGKTGKKTGRKRK